MVKRVSMRRDGVESFTDARSRKTFPGWCPWEPTVFVSRATGFLLPMLARDLEAKEDERPDSGAMAP
jgi:hypothetical protein